MQKKEKTITEPAFHKQTRIMLGWFVCPVCKSDFPRVTWNQKYCGKQSDKASCAYRAAIIRNSKPSAEKKLYMISYMKEWKSKNADYQRKWKEANPEKWALYREREKLKANKTK